MQQPMGTTLSSNSTTLNLDVTSDFCTDYSEEITSATTSMNLNPDTTSQDSNFDYLKVGTRVIYSRDGFEHKAQVIKIDSEDVSPQQIAIRLDN